MTSAADVAETGRSFGDFIRDHHEVLIVKPIRIVVIVAIAILVRWLVHRAITRAIRSTSDSDVPVVLRPLKERMGADALESAGLVSERRRQRAETVGSLLRSIASLVVGVLALMLVFGEIGFQLGPFLAGAGIVGVALGFGAQNLVKDFLSGIFMLLEDQYGVGDHVDLGDAVGTIERVGLRTTTVRDVTGMVWYVRNGTIERVGNGSQDHAVAVVDVPLPYETDIREVGDLMKQVADRMVAEDEWGASALEEPQLLGVESITDQNVTLRLTLKVRPADQWKVARELRRRIAERLETAPRPPAGTPEPSALRVRTAPARADDPSPPPEPASSDVDQRP